MSFNANILIFKKYEVSKIFDIGRSNIQCEKWDIGCNHLALVLMC